MTEEKSPSGGSVAGLVLSCLGVAGWAFVLALFVPYDNDGLHNVFAFGLNAILLIAGGGASTALSLAGFVGSSVSNSHVKSRQAVVGMALGALGTLTGLVVLSWRWNLVFG